MVRIFITGSSDGLGLLAAKSLIEQGHQVVLHARNAKRKDDVIGKIHGAEAILTGNLSEIEETKALAGKVNKLGTFDTIIHNAGIYNASPEDILTVNVIAPYLLTCLIKKPKSLIYIGSDMHIQGKAALESLKTGNAGVSYSDSKLLVLMLCKAVARKWPEVYVNAVDPGWVPTKMGGPGAPDNLQEGYETQVWLALGEGKQTKVSGRYFFHQKEAHSNPDADNVALQKRLLDVCAGITGISFS